jgi:dephospho-CoA kinase
MNPGARAAPAVAITGGIGCGKSEVARVLREDGVPVLDADDVARDVVAAGSDAARRIAVRFGEAVFLADGSLNRRKLAEIVFADERARADLNAIVHPPVREAMKAWAATQRSAGLACAGVIPLLFEVAAEKEWDFVVCVASDDEASFARLRARGWSDEQIALRRVAQISLEEKKRRSGLVIENNGSLQELAARVRAAWKQIVNKESRNGR